MLRKIVQMKEMNFEEDLKLEFLRISNEIGFKISVNQRIDKIILDYLTVRTKLIETKKREVLINPDFKSKIESNAKKKEIEFIIKLAEKGDNLNVFQSKRIIQTNFHDHLQNEWNIYHFHLSLEKDKKSMFVKQVNSLLFAYINENKIIFLGTEKHKEGIFGDEKWIEVLHDNFPKVIEKFKDDTIKEISPKLNAVERQMLWNKGYTIGMTKIRDVVYHNPGIGRATSGHSISITTSTSEIMRWKHKIENQLIDSKNEICEFLNVKTELAEFKLRICKKIELYEKTTNIKLLEFPEILIEKEEIIERNNIK